VNNLVQEILILKKKKQASIISVLTKQNSEDLATLLIKKGIKAAHLHCEMGAEERTKVIDDLQSAKLDVVVGINLLREGLDIPRTSTVFILDGDKKGFLRSFVSLTQLIGRAARHIDGRAIIYADEITIHIQRVLEVSTKRRRIQQKQQFN
jgi:excinuclease ABC subunit B